MSTNIVTGGSELTGDNMMELQKTQLAERKEIRKRFPDLEFPEPIIEPIYYGRKKIVRIDGKGLIRDAYTGAQYAVVSNKYHIVHHESVIKNLIDSIPEEFGEPKFNVNLLNDGARLSAEVTFPEINKEINGSPLQLMARVGNSYDTSMQFGWSWGAKELVCTNGLVAYRKKGSRKAKHLSGAIDKVLMTENLRKSMEDFSEQHEIWLDWTNKKLSKLEFDNVLEALPFSEKETEKLLHTPLVNHNGATLATMNTPTLWAVNSAATQFAQHNVVALKRTLILEEKISRTMHSFG